MPPRTKSRHLDAIERIDRASEAMSLHRQIWPYIVPVEVKLEVYRAVVQLFAEGLVDGSLTYAVKVPPAASEESAK